MQMMPEEGARIAFTQECPPGEDVLPSINEFIEIVT